MRKKKVIRNHRDVLSIIKRACKRHGITLEHFANSNLHITLSAMYRRIRNGRWSRELLYIIYTELKLNPRRLQRHNWNNSTWEEMLRKTSVYRPKKYFNSRLNWYFKDWLISKSYQLVLIWPNALSIINLANSFTSYPSTSKPVSTSSPLKSFTVILYPSPSFWYMPLSE